MVVTSVYGMPVVWQPVPTLHSSLIALYAGLIPFYVDEATSVIVIHQYFFDRFSQFSFQLMMCIIYINLHYSHSSYL